MKIDRLLGIVTLLLQRDRVKLHLSLRKGLRFPAGQSIETLMIFVKQVSPLLLIKAEMGASLLLMGISLIKAF